MGRYARLTQPRNRQARHIMPDEKSQGISVTKDYNSQARNNGRGIMTDRQQDQLASLLIDVGIMLGKHVVREVDRILTDRARQQERIRETQERYIDMHQYDIEID